MPQSQTAANPRHQEEEKKDKKKTTRAKQTKNAREAQRPAPSSPSEAYWAILLSFNVTVNKSLY